MNPKTRTDCFARATRTAILLAAGAGFIIGAGFTFGSSLQIAVGHTFEASPLQLDLLRYKNAAGETLSITRLSYLLSGFALEKPDGAWVELSGQVGWIDAAHHRANVLLENIPAGVYRGLRFSIGLDAARNHADPAKYPADHPLNPNLNGLHWNWQGGYIFLALEGHYQTTMNNRRGGFAYHLAGDTNETRVVLDAPLDLTRDGGLRLVFDLGRLLAAPRMLSFVEDGPSTHSRDGDALAGALVRNLPGAWSIRPIAPRAPGTEVVPPLEPLYLPAKFTPYPFKMGGTFPMPKLPRDNPLIEERVLLGETLFHENALSRDGSISCASCHKPSAAFSDPRRHSIGVGGQTGARQAMPLFNLAWKESLFWDGRAPTLRAQALMPIQDHAEMDETLANVISKLSDRRRPEARAGAKPFTPTLTVAVDYRALFTRAFGLPEITAEKIGLALEQFLLTLTSYESKFDRALRGEESLGAEEQRGFELFMTEYEPRTGHYGADCFHCHGGPLFSDHQFHNNGLDAAARQGDSGRFEITRREPDRGKFSTPSLRNVALTAPYMHDGRFATLEEVIGHYRAGVQRSATLDPNLAKHPERGLPLSRADEAALVAFLRTLTDERFEKKGGE